MNFLRNLLASIFGTLIALGIIFMLFVLIISTISESEAITVKSNSILEINLDAKIKDFAPKSDNPFDEIFDFSDGKIGLNEIINAIENAKEDVNIRGISITVSGIQGGFSQTQAIRNKLEEFKDSGKFIKSYADFYDQKAYYLSSVADSIFVNPFGGVDFKGLSSEVLYYKDIEEKTGVKMEVIRHGKYKSAVEPYLFNKMSVENREQITVFLTSIWNELLVNISENRNISIEDLNIIADSLLARTADLAVENNLVDEKIYLDEYNDKLKVAMGLSNNDQLHKISLQDYIGTGKGRIISSAPNKIAVIYAQGEIIYGKGNEDYIGQDLIINALKKARETNSIKAIVLRVDSPGGSALTSELIWRELELTKLKLPVVVSMGDVAASGGYYIACNADKIFAESATITGSIGVFGTILNISQLANKIGVNAEQVSTNKGASYSVFEPMTNEFREVTTEGVELVYNTFLERVAKGRGMMVEEVDSIAQGRVWSGVEALKNGLIDEIGSLDDAVSYAAELANVTDFKVRNYPDYDLDLEDKISSFPFMKSKEEILIDEIGEANYKTYQSLRQVSKLKGIQARIPFIIDIK